MTIILISYWKNNMKKFVSILAFVCIPLFLIAVGDYGIGSGVVFTNNRWEGEAEAEGGNSLLWGFSNNSYGQINAEISISAGTFSKTYSFVLPSQYGVKSGIENCDCEEPVKWKAYGRISYQYYGSSNQEVTVATMSINPSKLKDEIIELPQP